MFLRQRGRPLASTLLFLGQERRRLPVEFGRMPVIQGLIIVPGYGTQKGMTVPMQAGDVFGREGAAVGDELHGGRQRQMFAEEFVLFRNGGVAIAIAVERMAKDGDRPLVR